MEVLINNDSFWLCFCKVVVIIGVIFKFLIQFIFTQMFPDKDIKIHEFEINNKTYVISMKNYLKSTGFSALIIVFSVLAIYELWFYIIIYLTTILICDFKLKRKDNFNPS